MDGGTVTFLLVFLIGIAFLFDLLNGMHDAANSIATIVSTRVLSPFVAVLWAAFFNFSAYFIGHYFGFESKVASTIGKGLIDPEMVTNAVIFGALMGAIVWNVITWRLGIPSSSSHALVGGIIGAGVAKAGFSAIVWGGLSKTLIAIVLSPVTGFVLGILLVVLISWLFVRANQHGRTGSSASCSWSALRSTPSATGRTTRKKQPGLLRSYCMPTATMKSSPFPPGWSCPASQ